nr:uncharacterized protein LOC129380242 isoform X2 [Dermacentor andersoni]
MSEKPRNQGLLRGSVMWQLGVQHKGEIFPFPSGREGMDAYAEAVYPCVAKMAPLLTTKLNPECVAKQKIFTDDVAIAMAGIKWLLENFF